MGVKDNPFTTCRESAEKLHEWIRASRLHGRVRQDAEAMLPMLERVILSIEPMEEFYNKALIRDVTTRRVEDFMLRRFSARSINAKESKTQQGYRRKYHKLLRMFLNTKTNLSKEEVASTLLKLTGTQSSDDGR